MWQSELVSTHWAEQNLTVIRTLMERSAIYRRALSPVMLLTGALGLVAAGAGVWLKIESPKLFVAYWMMLSIVPLMGAYLLVRRQALRDAEAFWSPPTRRVTQALLPPMVAGLVAGLVTWARVDTLEPKLAGMLALVWLPLGWTVLYGCALHAAGFFMPRGIKLLGWCFIAGGCAVLALWSPAEPCGQCAHGVMGLFFGGLQLAYGGYLWFTERGKNVA